MAVALLVLLALAQDPLYLEYRTRVLDKLHVKSNAELARYAIENHLID